jgi:uncharacterized protein (DUF1697 family)
MQGRYVALVRGINIGRAKRVAMADLRALVASLGCAEVRTLLNSGNVVMSATVSVARGVAAGLERAMADRLGVSARVVLLSATELERVVADNPLVGIATDPSRHLVAFFRGPGVGKRLRPLLRRDWHPEILALGVRVAYLWCPEGFRSSRLPATLATTLGDAVTIRNWATVTRLHALCGGRSPAGD